MNSLNLIFTPLNSNIHGKSDIEFSEFIAIFDIWGVLVHTLYSKLRVLISIIAMISPYSIYQIPSKFDFRHCSFEYRYVKSNIAM